MSDLILSALRDTATAATPGNWTATVMGSEGYRVMAENPDGGIRRLVISRHDYEAWDIDKANAEYVAAFDPPTVLALLDRVEAAEAAIARVVLAIDHSGSVFVDDIHEALAGESR